MNPAVSVILCLAYIVGLLSTTVSQTIIGIPVGGLGLLVLSIFLPRAIPQFRRGGHSHRLWLTAGFIGLVATLHLAIRTPTPGPNDISRQIPDQKEHLEPQISKIEGKIISTPQLTRSQKIQFWVRVTQLQQEGVEQAVPRVQGKLYVTVPLLQATGLQPGQMVEASGYLYKPKKPANPGGFNFQAYLAQQGGFAGLRVQQVEVLKPSKPLLPSWWDIQRKIIQAQVRWLGVPEGPLVSSMVLGNRAVELPYDIRDQFSQAGLAHALAASGFQVSLILGVLLALTNRLPKKVQFGVGTGAIVIFLGLTGIQPSVLRASIMGIATLFALTIERKIKPLGSLLTAAVLILIFNPLWIWDLGFQFSFLATLGLLVTVPTLTKWLDWLPPTIAALITVPVAAYLWTIPLQLYTFGIVSPYAIPINILVTPLISLISLGGVISAVGAVIWPWNGSALAWLLYYPTHWLIELVNINQHLPGTTIASGTITVLQLATIYGAMLLVWLNQKWQPRWWVVGILCVASILGPNVWQQSHAQQFTVLAAGEQPILVIQNRGQTALLSSSDDKAARLTVIPFLQKEGINRLDFGMALSSNPKSMAAWKPILHGFTINTFLSTSSPDNKPHYQRSQPTNLTSLAHDPNRDRQTLTIGQTQKIGTITLKALSNEPSVLQLSSTHNTWFYIDGTHKSTQIRLQDIPAPPEPVDILWWNGRFLNVAFLEKLRPKFAIASANSVSSEIVEFCQKHHIQLYWTGRDGALEWSPGRGFKELLNSETDVFS